MKSSLLKMFLFFHLAVVIVFSGLLPPNFLPQSAEDAVAVYSGWTGGGHGYTFFAPEVGNQNVAKSFTLLGNGELVVDAYGSGENIFEVRMSSLIHTLYNSKVPELNARMIAAICFGKYTDAKVTEVSLGRYIVPSIEAFNRGEGPRFEEYYKGTFAREALAAEEGN